MWYCDTNVRVALASCSLRAEDTPLDAASKLALYTRHGFWVILRALDRAEDAAQPAALSSLSLPYRDLPVDKSQTSTHVTREGLIRSMPSPHTINE